MIPELSAITRLGAVIKLEQPADVAHHLTIIAAGFDVLRSRGDINTERLILAKESDREAIWKFDARKSVEGTILERMDYSTLKAVGAAGDSASDRKRKSPTDKLCDAGEGRS